MFFTPAVGLAGGWSFWSSSFFPPSSCHWTTECGKGTKCIINFNGSVFSGSRFVKFVTAFSGIGAHTVSGFWNGTVNPLTFETIDKFYIRRGYV